MKYWLIKTEPSVWSWEDQKREQITTWDGVKNYQASNNLKQMEIKDQCFFYHSVTDKKIMGIVQVSKTYYPDPTDKTGRFGMIDVKWHQSFTLPVPLKIIKNHDKLCHLAIVKQSRLSVMPIDEKAWSIICELGMNE